MNWDEVQGQWKQMIGSVREQWGKLTDDEVSEVEGKRERLEGKIQQHYGYTKEEAEKAVDDWLSSR